MGVFIISCGKNTVLKIMKELHWGFITSCGKNTVHEIRSNTVEEPRSKAVFHVTKIRRDVTTLWEKIVRLEGYGGILGT